MQRQDLRGDRFGRSGQCLAGAIGDPLGAACEVTALHRREVHRDALTCLEKAVASADAGVVRSKSDPLLDPIRKTVRFAAVERNLGYI